LGGAAAPRPALSAEHAVAGPRLRDQPRRVEDTRRGGRRPPGRPAL